MGGIYWLASYHKSGNTWLRIWLRHLRARDGDAVDLDGLDTPIASSRAWLDATLGFDTADLDFDEVDRLRPAIYGWSGSRDRIGYHKIHDACLRGPNGLPMVGAATLGAVYVLRNPLDVAASYAAHTGRTLDRAIDMMGDVAHCHNAHLDRLAAQVRQRCLDWSGHVRSWTEARDIAVHVVRYEDMHADPRGTLARVARFLGVDDDPVRIAHAVRESNFDRLRAREDAEGFAERPPHMPAFFRGGRAGGWRDELSDAQVARIIADHGDVMRRFGYLDAGGDPI